MVRTTAIVALWAVDRIWGLPLAPTRWKPDPVGFGDSVTAVFEVLLVAACAMLFTGAKLPTWRRTTVLVLTGAVVASRRSACCPFSASARPF